MYWPVHPVHGSILLHCFYYTRQQNVSYRFQELHTEYCSCQEDQKLFPLNIDQMVFRKYAPPEMPAHQPKVHKTIDRRGEIPTADSPVFLPFRSMCFAGSWHWSFSSVPPSPEDSLKLQILLYVGLYPE